MSCLTTVGAPTRSRGRQRLDYVVGVFVERGAASYSPRKEAKPDFGKVGTLEILGEARRIIGLRRLASREAGPVSGCR